MSTKNKLSYSVADQRHWQKRIKELTFGRTIRAYRLAEDWSLAEAAERIGISIQQLSDYEHGRKLPSIDKAYRIAKALGMMPQGVVIQLLNEQLRRAEIPLQVKVA
jgi:transcriptional regulator with XRE-family HTH domain